MVHRSAVLERAARGAGGRAARPGSGRSARPGLRCPGYLSPHCLGERDIPGPAVHRQRARHVPGPVRDRRILHLAVRGDIERSPACQGGQAGLSLREFASTFYVNPRRNPDFTWAFASRFMFILAYAFLTTYQAYYLLDKIGTAEADVPHQVFLGTLTQSVVIVTASLIGGNLSDRTGRRKIFVLTASIVYGIAMFVIAV